MSHEDDETGLKFRFSRIWKEKSGISGVGPKFRDKIPGFSGYLAGMS